MATMNPFANIFAASPFAPLQKHMHHVADCVEKLSGFIDAATAGDWKTAEKVQGEISALENQADDIKKQLRINLPNSLFLPVPRTDLLELISVQDKIANKAKDIAGLILGRELSFPEEIREDFKQYLARSIDTVKQAHVAIDELDELLETGFKGREVSLVEKMLTKLDELEHETDDLQIVLRRKLYAVESQHSAVDVMFIYKVIDWVGDLADRAQSTGNRLEILVAR